MSMLAERRRKTKWVINPTKKPLWTADSNGIKFGKELMEKMGWSAGKGLGAKEQGIQEPLKVPYKNDTKGMGFKGNDDDWIEQQDEFNVLLNQLRNSDDSSVVKVSEEEKNEIKSLEEKSRQSRARVHYQKFTRGKDLSRYSENDLACILGTNRMKKENLKNEEVVESEEKINGHLEISFGVTTINSGSIQDYFKRKWTGGRVQSKSMPDVEKEREEHSCHERPSFSSVFVESEEFSKKKHKKEDETLDGSEMNGDSGEKYEKRKKKKRKDIQTSEDEEPKSKRKKTLDEDYPVDEGLQNSLAGVASNEIENLLGNENDCDSSRERKKEKRKSKKDEGNDDKEANLMEVKKKKKKKEKKETTVENGYCDTEELPFIDCSLQADCPGREEELVKKKKRKTGNEVFGESKKESIEEHSLEVGMGEMNEAVEGEDVTKEKRKKKKYKDHGGNAGVDESSGKDEELGKRSDFCEGDTVEVESKQRKKKKDKQGRVECQNNENGLSNEIAVEKYDNGSSSNISTELEVKKKKKKKDKQDEKMECCSNESGVSCDNLVGKCDSARSSNSTAELEEIKKKRKKKEKQGDKMECQNNESGLFSEVAVEKCDIGSGSNTTTELEEIKKKRKKKEKQGDKMECQNNESGLFSEVAVEKCDIGSGSNSATELEVKKKKKKKEKQDEEMECCSNENEISGEIPLEKCDGGKNFNITTEEVRKKKKKDKHKTKEEDPDSDRMKEPPLEEAYQEAVKGPSETEAAGKKKKKKHKKEKEKSKDECSVEHQEQGSKESCPELECTNAEDKEKEGRRKKKRKKGSESEGNEEEGGGKEARAAVENLKANGQKCGKGGNAEIGTTAGIDRVEKISQRAAYEHVAGQHRYERVKKMMEHVHLSQFRGSNLACLDGYGYSLNRCETSAR